MEFLLVASIAVLVLAGLGLILFPKWRSAIVTFVIVSPIPPIP